MVVLSFNHSFSFLEEVVYNAAHLCKEVEEASFEVGVVAEADIWPHLHYLHFLDIKGLSSLRSIRC